MAKAKGRDVVIELMDSVAKLEATTARHADLLESLSEHAIAASVQMTGLSGHTAELSRRMNDVSQRMADVSQRMSELSQRMTSVEAELLEIARGFVEAVKLSRTLQMEVGRLARLLGEYAGESRSRFENIEGRLVRLEKKAG